MKKLLQSLCLLFIVFLFSSTVNELKAGAVTNVRNKCYSYLPKYRADASLTYPLGINPAFTCRYNSTNCFNAHVFSCFVDGYYGEAQINGSGSRRVTKSKWNRIAGMGYRIPMIAPTDSAGFSYSDFGEIVAIDSVSNSVRINEFTGYMSVPLGSNYGNTLMYVVWIPGHDSDEVINTSEVLYKGRVSLEFGQLITEGIFTPTDFNLTIDIDTATFRPVYKVLPAAGLTKNLPLGTIASFDNVTVSVFSEGGYGAFIESDLINPFMNAQVSFINEGFYNTATNRLNSNDTFTVYLRSNLAPFNIVDESKTIQDSVTFKSNLDFKFANDGVYYFDVRHRNTIQTWSKANGDSLRRGHTTNYNFTDSQTKAFGNNQTLKNSKWCFYSGDVDQNGFIQLSDLLQIYNSASVFQLGYVSSDVTGNSIVDLNDIMTVYNNVVKFVHVVTP